ncbi:hypothetical protein BC936DRAFT_142523 [Jimgerdemannia flammicorona]|uniref:FF domain-containing protein n=1 Tax=Jimgerdemannia flammicorona TaxID=994334 RepID=A0A433DF35_9FUNG|nr:hypothetical protein BC936DRAFT_142523 [Jimgerdemannia flammicorona]
MDVYKKKRWLTHLDRNQLHREEGSLRERERQVRRERAQRSRETDHSKSAAQREEGLLAFNTLLIDRIRTHSVTWADKRADLERDTRFHSAGLYEADRRQLFDEHVDKLHRTRVDQFHRLLDEHVRLDTTWLEVLPVVRDDPRATRLSRDEDALEKVFDAYMVERVKTAKKEFEELLRENQFVEFRVRWVGMGGGGAAAPGEEGEDTEPRVVPKLDLKEIHAVLKVRGQAIPRLKPSSRRARPDDRGLFGHPGKAKANHVGARGEVVTMRIVSVKKTIGSELG